MDHRTRLQSMQIGRAARVNRVDHCRLPLDSTAYPNGKADPREEHVHEGTAGGDDEPFPGGEAVPGGVRVGDVSTEGENGEYPDRLTALEAAVRPGRAKADPDLAR